MYQDLFIFAALYIVGLVTFGQFKERTPKLRQLAKIAVFFGITAVISSTFGQPWSLIWIAGSFGIGVAGHVWWTTRHGINPVTAEPR